MGMEGGCICLRQFSGGQRQTIQARIPFITRSTVVHLLFLDFPFFFLQHLLHRPIPLSLFQPFCCLRRVKQAGYDLDLRSCYFLYRLTWKVKLFYLNRWDIFTCEILCQKAEWEYPISVSIHARRTFGHTGFVIGRRQQSLPRVKRLSPPPYSSNAEACELWECKASGNSHHDPPICVMQEVRWRRGPGTPLPLSFCICIKVFFVCMYLFDEPQMMLETTRHIDAVKRHLPWNPKVKAEEKV